MSKLPKVITDRLISTICKRLDDNERVRRDPADERAPAY